MRRLGEHRSGGGQVLAPLDVHVAGQGADRDVAVVALDPVQVGDAGDVDDQLGPGEPQFEERDQALSPGHHLGLIAALLQDSQGLIQTRGSAIVKSCG